MFSDQAQSRAKYESWISMAAINKTGRSTHDDMLHYFKDSSVLMIA
jgi:hypothetical protein